MFDVGDLGALLTLNSAEYLASADRAIAKNAELQASMERLQSGTLGGGGSSDIAAKADANTAALQRETQATAELSSTQSGAVASIQAFNEARRQAAIAGTEAALADQKEAESLAALTVGETAATASVDAQRMSMAEYQTMIGGTTVNQAALTASTAGLTTANTGATASTAELTASERLLAEGEANIAEGNALIVASYLALNPLEEANVVATDAAAGANIRLQQSLGPISSSMAGLGTAAGITALAIGVVVGVSEVFAAKWESEMQRIQANTTLTDAGMKQMQQTVMQIGARSSAPLSELAQGYMRLSNEGFNAAQATKILDAAQQLAVGTGAKVSEVVNIVGVAMHDYKIPADEATQTTNLLLNAVKNGNTTMSEFASPLQRLTPIASQVGISFLDLTAAIATLTKEGVPAAMVYSQLMNTMVRMTEPTTAQEKELRKLSEATGKDLVTAWSAATIAGGGFENSIRLTHEALVQSGTEIQKLEPNMRGLTGGIALMGKGYEDWNNMIVSNDAAMRGDTTAQEAYQRSLETTAGKLGLLKNAAQEVAISLGQMIQVPVKSFLDDMTQGMTHTQNIMREFSIVQALFNRESLSMGDSLRVVNDILGKDSDDLDKLATKYGITNPLIEKNALDHALAAGSVKGNDDALDEHLNRLDRENSGLNGLQLSQRNTAVSTVGLTDSLTDLSAAAAKAGTSADGFSTNIKKVFDTLVAGIPAIITAGLDLEELNKVLAGGTSNNFLFAKSIGGMGEALKGVGALAASVSKSHTDATLAVRDEAKAYADDTRAQQALMEGKPALAAALTAEGVAFRGTDVAAQQLAERNVALATTQETLNTKIGREGVTAQKALTAEQNLSAQDQRIASELIVKGKLEEAAGYTEASQLESAGDKQGALEAIAAGKERQTASDQALADAKVNAKGMVDAQRDAANDTRAMQHQMVTDIKNENLTIPDSLRTAMQGTEGLIQDTYTKILDVDNQLRQSLSGNDRKRLEEYRAFLRDQVTSAQTAYSDIAAAASAEDKVYTEIANQRQKEQQQELDTAHKVADAELAYAKSVGDARQKYDEEAISRQQKYADAVAAANEKQHSDDQKIADDKQKLAQAQQNLIEKQNEMAASLSAISPAPVDNLTKSFQQLAAAEQQALSAEQQMLGIQQDQLSVAQDRANAPADAIQHQIDALNVEIAKRQTIDDQAAAAAGSAATQATTQDTILTSLQQQLKVLTDQQTVVTATTKATYQPQVDQLKTMADDLKLATDNAKQLSTAINSIGSGSSGSGAAGGILSGLGANGVGSVGAGATGGGGPGGIGSGVGAGGIGGSSGSGGGGGIKGLEDQIVQLQKTLGTDQQKASDDWSKSWKKIQEDSSTSGTKMETELTKSVNTATENYNKAIKTIGEATTKQSVENATAWKKIGTDTSEATQLMALALGTLGKAVNTELPNQITALGVSVGSGMKIVQGAFTDGMTTSGDAVTEGMKTIKTGFTEGMAGADTSISTSMTSIKGSFVDGLHGVEEALPDATAAIVTGMVEPVKTAATDVQQAFVGYKEGIDTGLQQAAGAAQTGGEAIGTAIDQGMIAGLNALASAVAAAASALVGTMFSAMKAAAGVQSPSTVAADIGQNIGAGITQGMKGTVGGVSGAAKELAMAAVGNLAADVEAALPILHQRHMVDQGLAPGGQGAGDAQGALGIFSDRLKQIIGNLGGGAPPPGPNDPFHYNALGQQLPGVSEPKSEASILGSIIGALGGGALGNQIATTGGIAAGSGVAYAEGGISAGGIALVGEKGPELVNLPAGAQVIPNNQIPHFADGTTGGLPSVAAVQTLAQQQLQTTLQQQTLTEVSSQTALTQSQSQILQQQTAAITSGTAAVVGALSHITIGGGGAAFGGGAAAATSTTSSAASGTSDPASAAMWNQITIDSIKEVQAAHAADIAKYGPNPQLLPVRTVVSQADINRAFGGSTTGFASGGILPEDIFGSGRSGQSYQLHAGETVVPVGGATVGAAAQAAMQTAQGASSGTVTVNVTVGGKTITQQVLANLSTNQALEVSIP